MYVCSYPICLECAIESAECQNASLYTLLASLLALLGIDFIRIGCSALASLPFTFFLCIIYTSSFSLLCDMIHLVQHPHSLHSLLLLLLLQPNNHPKLNHLLSTAALHEPLSLGFTSLISYLLNMRKKEDRKSLTERRNR